MARFEGELPTELIQQFERLQLNTEKMLEEMTKAGAECVFSAMKASAPKVMKDHIVVTRTYKTPSDDGINTKVMISGYFVNRWGQTVPAPLVANVYEYGRSNLPFPKHPFLRKSFNKGQIESAMLAVQGRYIQE
jgi:hypothetical protein